MSGERFPPDRAAAARAASADQVAISTRYRGIDGPGTRGGDFYARCETEQGTRVIIGDVRGKGAPAARKAQFLASAFLVLAAARPDLEAVSLALDHLAAADAAGEWDVAAREWFATAVLLEIDRQGRRVTVINHGHPAPVLVDGGGGANRADADGAGGVGAAAVRELLPSRPRLPLGLGDLAAVDGSADTVELGADATLLLFTDGVTEARDRTGRMFDPVAWLTAHARTGRSSATASTTTSVPSDSAAESASASASASSDSLAPSGSADPALLLDGLLVEVERHNGGNWRDDLALVSVRRSGVPVGGPRMPPPASSSPSSRDSSSTSSRSSAPSLRCSSSTPPGRVPPVTLPPAMVPSAQATRRPVAPPRPRAPRSPSRRPGGWPFPDGTMLP